MSSNVHSSCDARGTIVNIQHFCLHDGDGIRTTVFFKGCAMSCIWCCNPETQRKEVELACYRNLCNGCMKCADECELNALQFKGTGIRSIAPSCSLCMRCVTCCDQQALKCYGRKVTVKEVMTEIREDRLFYEASKGGVTLSGGEVLQQPDFAISLLKACREEGIHTIVESSAYAPWEIMREVAECCDELYIDIKHMDTSLHKMYTGVSNEQILSNIHHLSHMNKDFVIRIPIIPGINDDENLLDTFIFVHKLVHCRRIGLIPYQKFGISKYDALGRTYLLKSLDVPDDNFLNYYKKLCIEHFHMPCEIGW